MRYPVPINEYQRHVKGMQEKFHCQTKVKLSGHSIWRADDRIASSGSENHGKSRWYVINTQAADAYCLGKVRRIVTMSDRHLQTLA